MQRKESLENITSNGRHVVTVDSLADVHIWTFSPAIHNNNNNNTSSSNETVDPDTNRNSPNSNSNSNDNGNSTSNTPVVQLYHERTASAPTLVGLIDGRYAGGLFRGKRMLIDLETGAVDPWTGGINTVYLLLSTLSIHPSF